MRVLHLRGACIDRTRIAEILAVFPSLKIAVFGDFYLDKYLVTDPALDEPSIETGLTARQVIKIRCSPGAAGTVASNLAALGVGKVFAVGMIGSDGEGFDLTHALRSRGIRTEGLIVSQQWRTPCYMKPTSGELELERLDIHNYEPPRLKSLRKALDSLESLEVDGIHVGDQRIADNGGVVSELARERIMSLDGPPILVDSRSRIALYRSVIVKPNLSEAAGALGEPADPARSEEYALAMSARTSKPAFITLGSSGIAVASEGVAATVPAHPIDGPIDITGAGDAAAAALIACIAAGATPTEAAVIANLAAAVAIQKIGTTGTATQREILALVT
jgi:rfaE bifunctional protein kinase chain/domain